MSIEVLLSYPVAGLLFREKFLKHRSLHHCHVLYEGARRVSQQLEVDVAAGAKDGHWIGPGIPSIVHSYVNTWMYCQSCQ